YAPTGFVGGSTSSPFGHIQTPDAFRDIYPCAFLARNEGASGLNVATDYHCYRNKTSAAFQLAPDPLTTAGGLVISADSYYNPFGIEYRRGEGSAGFRLVTVG